MGAADAMLMLLLVVVCSRARAQTCVTGLRVVMHAASADARTDFCAHVLSVVPGATHVDGGAGHIMLCFAGPCEPHVRSPWRLTCLCSIWAVEPNGPLLCGGHGGTVLL